MKTVAEKFRRLREKRGLSQQQVADSIGVSAAMVSRLESNPRQLKVDYIDQFATYYEVTLRKLFSKKEEKFNKKLAKVKVQITLPTQMNNSTCLFELAHYLEEKEKQQNQHKQNAQLCKSLH